MEVALVTGGDGVPMEQTCGLHGGVFLADTSLLIIQEQNNYQGGHKQICSSVWRYDTIGFMVLHVSKSKLGRAVV